MTYSSWVQLASRSFPRRWRAVRGQELVETTSDLALTGATRPSPRILADLVMSGLRERKRSRPPFGRWLWYSLGGTLPVTWHPWMRDELSGRWFWAREGLRRTLPLMLFVVVALVVGHQRKVPSFFVMYVPITVALSALMVRISRRRIWKRHGYTSTGDWASPTPHRFYPQQPVKLRPSLRMIQSLRLFGGGFVVASACWFYGAAFPHETFHILGFSWQHDPNSPMTRTSVAVVAAIAGLSVLVLGPLLDRSLKRKPLPDRPALTPSARRERWEVQLALLFFAALPTVPASTGVLPAMATAAVGAACLLLGGIFLTVAILHPHSQLTWDDVTRSRKDPAGHELPTQTG
jgi:Family of unknown function (DUF5313)